MRNQPPGTPLPDCRSGLVLGDFPDGFLLKAALLCREDQLLLGFLAW